MAIVVRMLNEILTRHAHVQILLESDEHLPPRDSDWWQFCQGKRCSFFGSALQRKIQTSLARFWQERFISLRTADAPTAHDLLLRPGFHLDSDHHVEAQAFAPTDPARLDSALELAELPASLLDRELTRFSNGELRRLLLARGWMENPELWILDDPFGGLDTHFRAHLATRIATLAEQEIPLLVFLRREDERLLHLPAYRLRQGFLHPWDVSLTPVAPSPAPPDFGPRYHQTQLRPSTPQGIPQFELAGVCVQFDGQIVMGPLDWTVRQGEHWAILGPNGAGKSTLLGLLTADHPQIYRNPIRLLGQVPGQGLSVWEHRARIGFFSPELALHYREPLNLLETVCSGFGSALGLLAPPTPDERARALAVLSRLGLGSRAAQPLRELDADERRLVLIARALIRPPEVLILDEPTQGMDPLHRDRLFALLTQVAEHSTLLMVTHYPGEWPECITHVLQL